MEDRLRQLETRGATYDESIAMLIADYDMSMCEAEEFYMSWLGC